MEYYKRTQKVIQAPVLLKLNSLEEQEMKEIEENYEYEEIVAFRTQALEKLQNKILKKNTDKRVAESEEKLIKYMKEYYSDIFSSMKTIEIADKTEYNEYKPKKTTKTKFELELNFSVPQIIVSLQVLSTLSEPSIEFLSKEGCECTRCKKPEIRIEKKFDSQSQKIKLMKVVRKEGELTNFQYKIRGPPRHSLLPSGKMRDVAIEHGEDVYNIGSICFKNNKGEPFELNMLKESTLFIVVINFVSFYISANVDEVYGNIKVCDMASIDPLSCVVPEFYKDYKKPEKAKTLGELRTYKGWFSSIFKESDNNSCL